MFLITYTQLLIWMNREKKRNGEKMIMSYKQLAAAAGQHLEDHVSTQLNLGQADDSQ